MGCPMQPPKGNVPSLGEGIPDDLAEREGRTAWFFFQAAQAVPAYPVTRMRKANQLDRGAGDDGYGRRREPANGSPNGPVE